MTCGSIFPFWCILSSDRRPGKFGSPDFASSLFLLKELNAEEADGDELNPLTVSTKKNRVV